MEHLFIFICCFNFSSLCPFMDLANFSTELSPVWGSLLVHQGADPDLCVTHMSSPSITYSVNSVHVSFDIQRV